MTEIDSSVTGPIRPRDAPEIAKRMEAALARIKSSAQSGQLVAVVGSGVSIALTNGKNESVSWKGLIESGFAYGVIKSKILPKQREGWECQLA
jgi:hypothetical protein